MSSSYLKLRHLLICYYILIFSCCLGSQSRQNPIKTVDKTHHLSSRDVKVSSMVGNYVKIRYGASKQESSMGDDADKKRFLVSENSKESPMVKNSGKVRNVALADSNESPMVKNSNKARYLAAKDSNESSMGDDADKKRFIANKDSKESPMVKNSGKVRNVALTDSNESPMVKNSNKARYLAPKDSKESSMGDDADKKRFIANKDSNESPMVKNSGKVRNVALTDSNESPMVKNSNKARYLVAKDSNESSMGDDADKKRFIANKDSNSTQKPLLLKHVEKRVDNIKNASPGTVQEQNDKRLEFSETGFDLTDEEMKKFKIWPQGMIPYFIDDYSYDKVLRDRLRGYLVTINQITGLHFIELPKPPENEKERWVFFVNRRGQLTCSDYTNKIFTNEGVQRVVLGYDCMSNSGQLASVVLALAGVPPQHNSPDRDQYVTIDSDNIVPGKEPLFAILNNSDWLFHDVKYDFQSAGHYSWHKYSKNGIATIRPTNNIDLSVGEDTDFSYSDVWKIRMLYNYISNKKNVKVPECHKMFEPGTDFGNYSPNSDNDVEPRQKPDKYLGTVEEKPVQPRDDDPKNIVNDSNEDKEKRKGDVDVSKNANSASIDDNASGKSDKEKRKQPTVLNNAKQNSDKASNNGETTLLETSNEINQVKSNTVPVVLHHKKKHKDNPIEVLSDYTTYENMSDNDKKDTGSGSGRRHRYKTK